MCHDGHGNNLPYRREGDAPWVVTSGLACREVRLSLNHESHLIIYHEGESFTKNVVGKREEEQIVTPHSGGGCNVGGGSLNGEFQRLS